MDIENFPFTSLRFSFKDRNNVALQLYITQDSPDVYENLWRAKSGDKVKLRIDW